MPDWITKLFQEWAVISAAPISFFGTLFVLAVAIWAVVNRLYNTTLSNKNATIELLNGRLAAYQDKLKGASPEQAAGEIIALRAELQALKNPPRDPDGIYQHGAKVGEVSGSHKRPEAGMVEFATIKGARNFERNASFEYHDLVLTLESAGGTMNESKLGIVEGQSFLHARCRIIGRV